MCNEKIVLAAMASLFFLVAGCGRRSTHTELMDETVLQRFEAPEVLDVLSDTQNNSRLAAGRGVTDQQIDSAFAALDGKLKVDNTRALRLDANFDAGLSGKQKAGFRKLDQGFRARMQEGAITLKQNARTGQFVVVPANGLYTSEGAGPLERAPGGGGGGVITHAEADAGVTDAAPDHRIGDGRWSWSLRYKWYGVRLYVNHNFLNYLCYNTEWMLSRANLPSWIKIVIRPLGCLLHRLDSTHNGSSISITWAGAFWYSP